MTDHTGQQGGGLKHTLMSGSLMLRRFYRWLGLVMALACVTMSAGVYAQTIIVGGPGGGNFDDRCPEGAFLVGVVTDAGNDLNRITPICQVFVNGHTVGPTFNLRTWGNTVPQAVGGTGIGAVFVAGPGPTTCPADMAVQGMQVQVSKVKLVHAVALRCRNPNAHDYVITPYNGSAQGNGASAYEAPVDCGGGAIANGLIGRYGSLVDALGLSCKVLVAQASTPIKETGRPTLPTNRTYAKATMTTRVYLTADSSFVSHVVCTMAPGDFGYVISGGPDRWIFLGDIIGQCGGRNGWVETGTGLTVIDPTNSASKLPPESTAPFAASLAAYAGVWSVTTVQNARYQMTLHVNGDVLTGEFKNLQNDIYSGTLTGKLLSNGAAITWVQPRNLDSTGQPSQGKGRIAVHTDNTFGGGITYQAPGAVQGSYYAWHGTRASATPPATQPIATAVAGDTVYKNNSGDPSPANVACTMSPGDQGTVNQSASGPAKWLFLEKISGQCNGKSGYVWNDGELTVQ